MNRTCKAWILVVAGMLCAGVAFGSDSALRPNIMWIIGEDASPHLGCYGETAVRTPNLDRMATQGVRFTNAFTTCPVCSPCRSALITGMYQTTLGAHNHRSQQTVRKGGGNTAYYDSYELPEAIMLIPQLFQEAGYFTTIGDGPASQKLGKTDYNFIFDPSVYHSADWRLCPADRPFFAQVMLMGGKLYRTTKHHGTNPRQVTLPPYYADVPELRRCWAEYLNTWVEMDEQVGEILAELDSAGKADNTIVFFFTDHGVAHVRGKQFLYDEGIHVPLIVRFPNGHHAGTKRDDLVLQIDVAATSLAAAGIAIPDTMHGRDLYASDYRPRDAVICARDRCDETVDIIRCVRTDKFKYIRNFMSFVSHAQPNDSKDHSEVMRTMRRLYADGRLNDLQARVFGPTRPMEELYDLDSDPFETVNLAADPEYGTTLRKLRERLNSWMIQTCDLGLIPEPILEDLGRTHGNKYFVLQDPQRANLTGALLKLFEAGENQQVETLLAALRSPDASMRYWGATWLAVAGDEAAAELLLQRLDDPEPAVRIAAALSLYQLDRAAPALEVLAEELRSFNLITGLFAMRAFEMVTTEDRAPFRKIIAQGRNSPYEFTRRIADRISDSVTGEPGHNN